MSDYIEFYHYKNGGGRSAKSSNSGIVLDISHAWDSKRSKHNAKTLYDSTCTFDKYGN